MHANAIGPGTAIWPGAGGVVAVGVVGTVFAPVAVGGGGIVPGTVPALIGATTGCVSSL